MGDSHDNVPEFYEDGTLEGLREEVCYHDAGRAMDEVDLAGCDTIFDEEVPDIDVTGFWPAEAWPFFSIFMALMLS